MGKDARVVAGPAEDVDILRLPPDARVGADGVGARQHEWDRGCSELADGFAIEILGFGACRSRLRLGIQRGYGHRTPMESLSPTVMSAGIRNEKAAVRVAAIIKR